MLHTVSSPGMPSLIRRWQRYCSLKRLETSLPACLSIMVCCAKTWCVRRGSKTLRNLCDIISMAHPTDCPLINALKKDIRSIHINFRFAEFADWRGNIYRILRRDSEMEKEMIIVMDFGGQYNQLIARRVRECNVSSPLLFYFPGNHSRHSHK